MQVTLQYSLVYCLSSTAASLILQYFGLLGCGAAHTRRSHLSTLAKHLHRKAKYRIIAGPHGLTQIAHKYAVIFAMTIVH